MRNVFVDYLNTLHGAAGANANALAESQAVNPCYEKIKVERRIADYIARLLRGEPHCIILTGHAGDGKTGLLHQVLMELGLTQPSVSIPPHARMPMVDGTRGFFFVKDMSELAAADQEQLLLQALSAPREGDCSILVSNTGPLLNTFKRLQGDGRLPGSFRDFQSVLLSAMDAPEPATVRLDGYTFTLINMARIDNVGMAGLLLRKITAEDNWTPCEACSARNHCPVLNNVMTVRGNLDRTTRFIETCLLWLQEHDSRLTLRQILAHIAYAITSNLSCDEVRSKLSRSTWSLFRFHFANALWGFHGIDYASSSAQIRAIQALRDLQLDETSVPDDYRLFVQKDIGLFDDRTAELIKSVLNGTIFANQVSAADLRVRRSVRRFYYLFASRQSIEDFERLLASLFSPVLPVYLRIRHGKADLSDLESVKEWVARGLYRAIVGVPRPEKTDRIHVTLRPDRAGITGVQLLLGEIDDDEIVIGCKARGPFADYLDDRQSCVLVLQIHDSGQEHVLSLPLLDYLYRLGEGAISTRLNPYLSHGIDRIKASFMEYLRTREDEIRLLVLTADGPKTVRIAIKSDHLIVK